MGFISGRVCVSNFANGEGGCNDLDLCSYGGLGTAGQWALDPKSKGKKQMDKRRTVTAYNQRT
jgi:hypothetical protein